MSRKFSRNLKRLCNAKLSTTVGLTIMEMMDGLESGKIKGLVIMGENPAVSDPDINHVKHALKVGGIPAW